MRDAVATGRRAELEEERDFLLRSLDDLDREHEAGDLEDHDHRALKADYTARAATVLRRLQALDTSPAPVLGDADQPAEDDPGACRFPPIGGHAFELGDDEGARAAPPVAGGDQHRRHRGAGRWGGLPRHPVLGERLPGQESSGGPDRGPRALLQQGIDADNAGQLVEAAKLYDAVLAEDPENVLALTRRGWVLGRSGRQSGNPELLQAGLGYLERATKIDPSFADAHAFKGLVLGALKRPAEAVCEFRAWLAIAPIDEPQRPALEGVHDEALKLAGGTVDSCPKPPVPVPVGEVPAAPAPAAP